MAVVRLFHWKSAEAGPLIAKLRSAGYEVAYKGETQSPSVREIRDTAPAAIMIDLSRRPSHGRDVVAWVRGSKSIRNIPIVFMDGDSTKVEAIRREIPDAVYTTQARLPAALKRVKPLKDPMVPRQMMETDPSRTAAQKLGIREGAVVGLIDPPADYKKVLGKLPAGVVLEENRIESARWRCGSCAIRASMKRRFRHGGCWLRAAGCGFCGRKDAATD